MVNSTVSSSGNLSKVFDDWDDGLESRRGAPPAAAGATTGLDQGPVLGRENAQSPVATEVTVARHYLDAVWGNAIITRRNIVQDWWCLGRYERDQHHELLLRPRVRLPARVQHVLPMYKIAEIVTRASSPTIHR